MGLNYPKSKMIIFEGINYALWYKYVFECVQDHTRQLSKTDIVLSWTFGTPSIFLYLLNFFNLSIVIFGYFLILGYQRLTCWVGPDRCTLIEPLCKADVNLNFNLSRLKFQNKREVIRPTLRVCIISLICIQVKKSLKILVISA